MIAVGSSNRCVWWWAQHLEADNNEDVRVVQTHGLAPGSIRDMLEELMDLARGTRCKNPFYEIHFSPAPGERLTEKEWDRVREMVETHHGFEGQPYFMVIHTKKGQKHAHIIYSRIDLETGKTISDSYDARTNHAISREIEQEFGLQKVVGPYDLEPDEPRPERAPKRWEMYRGMKTAIDPREIAAQVTELMQHCDNGRAFQVALEECGYELVTGKRGLLILDSAGKEHSLARRCGIKTKELDEFMCDVDRDALPSVEQAKTAYQERKIAALEADRATVTQEIEWEEKLAQAAIEKEKVHEKFIAADHRPSFPSVTVGSFRELDRNWDRDRANQIWEDAVIAAAIKEDKFSRQFAGSENAFLADAASTALDAAGTVLEIGIECIEMVADFLTGATPKSHHHILAEILADIDALKRRGERSVSPQDDLIGKMLQAGERLTELGMEGFEMLADFFGGATQVTPERIEAAIQERKQLIRQAAAEQRLEQWAAARRSDIQLDRRRDPQHDIKDEQRRYYQGQFELER